MITKAIIGEVLGGEILVDLQLKKICDGRLGMDLS